MAQAAVPVLNILILGSFMAYSLVQVRNARAALSEARIEDDR